MADFPNDRRYTKDHEWAREDALGVKVGITQHAVDALGDVTLVNLDIKAGSRVEAGKPFGTVESVKAVSDLFAPITGSVVKVNPDLDKRPELVNEDCYERGWMVILAPDDAAAVQSLLDGPAYTRLVGTLDH